MERLESRVEQGSPLQEGIVNDGPVRIDLDTLLSETEEVVSSPWKAYKEMSIDDESDDRIIKEFSPDGEVRIISVKNGIPKETTYGEKGRKIHEEGTLRVEGKVSPYRFYTSAVALVGTDRDGNSINQGRLSLADDFRSLYERIHGAGSYPETVSVPQTAEPEQIAPAESELLEAQREQIEALNEQSRLLREQNEELRRQNDELRQANADLRQELEDLRGQILTRDQVEDIVQAGVIAGLGYEGKRNEAKFRKLEEDNAYLEGELADARSEIAELRDKVGVQDSNISEIEERVSLTELASAVPAVEDEEDEKLPDAEIQPVGPESDEDMEETPWPGSDGIDPTPEPVKEHVRFSKLNKKDRALAEQRVADVLDGPAKKDFFLLDVQPETEGVQPEPLLAGKEVVLVTNSDMQRKNTTVEAVLKGPEGRRAPVEIFGDSVQGEKNPANQDRAFVLENGSGMGVFDGTSSTQGAEEAAEIAKVVFERIISQLKYDATDKEIKDAIRKAFGLAHKEITKMQKQNPEHSNMQTSAATSFIRVDNDHLTVFWGNIGTTSIKIYRKGRIINLSPEPVNDDAIYPLGGAYLTPKIQLDSSQLKPGDTLLLLTNGITRTLTFEEIQEASKRRQTAKTMTESLMDASDRKRSMDGSAYRGDRTIRATKIIKPKPTTNISLQIAA